MQHYQVADVLMLVANVGPVAVYFLVLGLVNSHARPCLVSTRSDFVALTAVLLPLLLWPVPDLIRAGLYGPLFGGLFIAAAMFGWLLPGREDGVVIYNISEWRCRRILMQTLRRLGLTGRWEDGAWTSDDESLVIELRRFPPLRNVSVHFDARSDGARIHVRAICDGLNRAVQSVSQGPSNMGIALTTLGLGLLILPMWMLTRHVDDIVDAMTHLFG